MKIIKTLFVIATTLLTLSTANGAEPLTSIDEFENQLNKCLIGNNAPTSCLNKLLTKHLMVLGDSGANQQVDNLTNLLKQWIDKDSFYALHKAKAVDVGNVIFSRIYLLEDSSGNLMLANLTFRKIKGILYLSNISFSSKDEAFNNYFGIKW